MRVEESGERPPKDRCNLIYLAILLQGIGGLTAWNMLITPKEYFVDFKLGQSGGDGIAYDTYFLNFVGFASHIPSVSCSWLNVFVPCKGALGSRLALSIVAQIIVFIVTIVLAMIDTTTWTSTFFWITMLTIAMLNCASGTYQNCIFGIAGQLPEKYSGAAVFGMNLCGTVVTVVSLITSLAVSNIKLAAIYYFLAALVVLLACFDTYYALPLNRFYRYYERLASKDSSEDEEPKYIPRLPVLRQCKMQCFNVFFTYFVTLALFPAVQSDIRRSDENFFINEKFYTPIMCFLTYNVTAMLGSSLFNWVQWPGPKYLTIFVVLRALFIPIYLFCNYRPKFDDDFERVIPVLFDNDWVFWIFGILMGLTNGYFGSLAMMYCSRVVEPRYSGIAGMLGGSFLLTGVFCGVVFSTIFPQLVRMGA